jgi:hypothetical protein
MAIALRAGMVSVKEPPDPTVILEGKLFEIYSRFNMLATHDIPEQVVEDMAPEITSQYFPAGREVENVLLQAESSLFIATNPIEPVKYMKKEDTTSYEARPDLCRKRYVESLGKPTWSSAQNQLGYGS